MKIDRYQLLGATLGGIVAIVSVAFGFYWYVLAFCAGMYAGRMVDWL